VPLVSWKTPMKKYIAFIVADVVLFHIMWYIACSPITQELNMEYTIDELKAKLKEENERNSTKDYHGNYALRLEKIIELRELGCRVEEDPHGLLVNGKYIVAVAKDKWCVAGKYKWYYHSGIPSFVKKYVQRA